MKKLTPALLGALLLSSSAVLAAGADMSALESKVAELQKQMQHIHGSGPAVGHRKGNEAVSRDWLTKTFVSSGNTKMTANLYGQISRAAVFVDDGMNSEVAHVDSDLSSTRFGVKGMADLNDKVSVGTNFEIEAVMNSSASVNQFDVNVGTNSITGRIYEIWADWDTYGRLSFGRGHMSSDDMAELSLAGASSVEYSATSDLVQGMQLRDKSLTSAAFEANSGSNPTIASTFGNMDGGRMDRVRYDSPVWNGVQASASSAARGNWDVSATHNWSNDSYTSLLAVAHRHVANGDEFLIGSASVKHKDTGLSLTFNGGNVDRKGTGPTTALPMQNVDSSFRYILGGWDTKLNDMGDTSFGVGYYRGDDQRRMSDESVAWGFAAVQNIDAVGAEVFLSVKRFDYDEKTSTKYDHLRMYGLGARVKF